MLREAVRVRLEGENGAKERKNKRENASEAKNELF